jgi:RNA polymerase sigma-70 factor (ECF subfamily)
MVLEERMDARHEAFMAHFLKAEPVLRGYVMAACRNAASADDIVQQTSTVLWERFSDYDESRPFNAWAVGIARLEVLKWRQKLARSKEHPSPEALELLAETAVEHADEIAEQRAHLGDCLGRLTDRSRHVLKLRYHEQRPSREIAEAEGGTVAAIDNLLTRARRALRECIERRTQSSAAAGGGA